MNEQKIVTLKSDKKQQQPKKSSLHLEPNCIVSIKAKGRKNRSGIHLDNYYPMISKKNLNSIMISE